METLVGWGNWMSLGCPAEVSRYVPYDLRGGDGRLSVEGAYRPLSSVQKELVSRLLEDVRPLFRLCPVGTAGSSRGRQADFLAVLETLVGEGSGDPLDGFPELGAGTVAKEVIAARARLPKEAAICDPADHIEGARRETVLNYPEALKMEEEERPRTVPRSAHKVSVEEERKLFREMLRIGMAALVEEADVVKGPDNQPLVGGLLCGGLQGVVGQADLRSPTEQRAGEVPRLAAAPDWHSIVGPPPAGE